MKKYRTPKYPKESKNLMLSLIGGLIVALIVIAIDILKELFPVFKLTILWIGFGFLFVLFLLCLKQFTRMKQFLTRKK